MLSVVDMDDSRLSIELLLVACKLLRLALRGLPDTDGLAVEFDIATVTESKSVHNTTANSLNLAHRQVLCLQLLACLKISFRSRDKLSVRGSKVNNMRLYRTREATPYRTKVRQPRPPNVTGLS